MRTLRDAGRELMTIPVCYPLWRRGLCKRCGKQLTGRRRLYCSDECRDVYADNHYWPAASALCKDGAGYRCEQCQRGRDELKKGYWQSPLEAHHILKLTGDRSESCENHQANLVCLCAECHGKRHSSPKAAKPLSLFDLRPYTAPATEEKSHQATFVW